MSHKCSNWTYETVFGCEICYRVIDDVSTNVPVKIVLAPRGRGKTLSKNKENKNIKKRK